MIRLTIARHAKSDWSDGALSDHDRPLNRRGERDAPLMAARLTEADVHPAVLLSSTAVRALTTARVFGDALGLPVDARQDLYGASADELLSAATSSGADDVMIVAHDPGMTDLAGRLSRGRIDRMPTCAIATFAWETDDWTLVDAIEPASWDHLTPR
ncbi:histidine phosphatase family protein [Microbacterium aquimaris]|uniref:SixA phosphatase family protein n=1 Tax=Microbacterium aquimaris TaxID=459816 RepID=UPI002AD5949B|nr:histidine phosphatase family protein [Microbacterium aquimaris]MDZ8277038.1 histidine phosphatase family protein [Microbacterium aquimaris]